MDFSHSLHDQRISFLNFRVGKLLPDEPFSQSSSLPILLMLRCSWSRERLRGYGNHFFTVALLEPFHLPLKT